MTSPSPLTDTPVSWPEGTPSCDVFDTPIVGVACAATICDKPLVDPEVPRFRVIVLGAAPSVQVAVSSGWPELVSGAVPVAVGMVVNPFSEPSPLKLTV